MKPTSGPLGCPCGGKHLAEHFTYHQPPQGEIHFNFSEKGRYHRRVMRCQLCGHFVSVHEMDEGDLYQGGYVDANYQDLEGIRRTFERITSLPPEESDNKGRVKRVLEFAQEHFGGLVPLQQARSVLDVGSGLCVFLHEMKSAGWDCTALDPDARAVAHATETVGVTGVQGDFRKVTGLPRFDVICFNRVLEHIPEPVPVLAKAKDHLAGGGFIYVELPDGEDAAKEGAGREEFFIDHHHVFSPASIVLLARRAGMSLVLLERLRDPSGKYTLRAFLQLEAQ